jgi:hypothetical protein
LGEKSQIILEANNESINKLISCVEIFKRNNKTHQLIQENRVFSKEKELKQNLMSPIDKEENQLEHSNPLKSGRLMVKSICLYMI